MTALEQRKLAEVSVDSRNLRLTVLVLSKSEPRYFLGRDDQFHGVINYTVRDSRLHIVNCKCWGSKEKVQEYHRKLKIGDVIDIIRPYIEPSVAAATNRYVNLYEQNVQQQRFHPLPTLPIALVVNEGFSTITKHDYKDTEVCRELYGLMSMPHKPLYSTLQLADVRCTFSGNESQAQYIDLLVMVALIRAVKKIPSKCSNDILNCLELIVFDQSTPQGMSLSIWNSDWIQRAEQHWSPLKTILHLIDVRAMYSKFYHSPVLTFTSRTLLYENPCGKESQDLMIFAKVSVVKNFNFLGTGVEKLPNPEDIVTQMSVRQIYSRVEVDFKNERPAESFTAVLYGMVTKFDIDGYISVINRRCKFCQRRIAHSQIFCDSDQCHLAISINDRGDKYEEFFNINIQFSDHTGTLLEGRLSDDTAERILKVDVNKFQGLAEAQKEELKWCYLFEHFEAKLLIRQSSLVRGNLTIAVIAMRRIDLVEFAKKVAVF